MKASGNSESLLKKKNKNPTDPLFSLHLLSAHGWRRQRNEMSCRERRTIEEKKRLSHTECRSSSLRFDLTLILKPARPLQAEVRHRRNQRLRRWRRRAPEAVPAARLASLNAVFLFIPAESSVGSSQAAFRNAGRGSRKSVSAREHVVRGSRV